MARKKKAPRKAAVKKARARQAEKAGKELGKQTLMEGIQTELEKYNSDVKGKLLGFRTELNLYIDNMRELRKAQNRSDEQFAVLTRMAIGKLNEVVKLQNRILKLALDHTEESPEVATIEEVTYEGVNSLFEAYAVFRARPDFKEHIKTWFLGHDMSTLPPLPEAKEEVETAPEAADEGHPEGAQIFGGNYGNQNGNSGEEHQAEQPEEEADTVLSLQEGHHGESQAGNEAENAVVS